jgi:hypothetical protein
MRAVCKESARLAIDKAAQEPPVDTTAYGELVATEDRQ